MRHLAEYLERDVSWVDFNRRVLWQAEDAANPLAERLNFLSIVYSNLDEFIKVRVGGIIRRIQKNDEDSEAYQNTLNVIIPKVRALLQQAKQLFYDELIPELSRLGVTIERGAVCNDLLWMTQSVNSGDELR